MQGDRRRFLAWLVRLVAFSPILPDSGRILASSSAVGTKSTHLIVDLKSDIVLSKAGSVDTPIRLGSVMKLITSYALVHSQGLSADDYVDCGGRVVVGSRSYNCPVAHGKVCIVQALAKSCNVFFAVQSRRITPEELTSAVYRLNLPDALAKVVQNASDFTFAALGYDERCALTLNQLVGLAKLLARPPLNLTRGCEPIRRGMALARILGTASQLSDHPWQPAVKTGTSLHFAGKYTSSVIGYAPTANPRVAFALHSVNGVSKVAAVPELASVLAGLNPKLIN